MSRLNKVINTNTILKSVTLPNDHGEIHHHFKDDALEVNTILLNDNIELFLFPPTLDTSLNLYYLLEGEFVGKKGVNPVLKKGQILKSTPTDDTVYVKSVCKSKLLVYSYNSNFYELCEERFVGLIRAIESLDEIDGYTSDHTNEVSRLVLKIGEKLGWVGNRLTDVVFAARYHDIGNLTTPSQLLTKNAELTQSEFEIMKQHVLNGIPSIQKHFSKTTVIAILQHHERLDGSGYPYGLESGQIIDEAKIIAVVDSFHAMTRERPYRRAKTIEAAIEELYSQAGTLYDKIYIDKLVEVLQEL